MALEVVILAAGKGSRMKSTLPKVLHKLAGISLVRRVVNTATALHSNKTHIVYGHAGEQIKSIFEGEAINLVEQVEQKGTGHAVSTALPSLDIKNKILILYGDVPLLSAVTLNKLILESQSGLSLLTVNLDNPYGYGRIIRDIDNRVRAIVEHKDTNENQRKVKEVNTGIMCVSGELLSKWLPQLSTENSQGEYYLTDIVAMAEEEGIDIATVQPEFSYEVEGVNNRKQLVKLERIYQQVQADQLMAAGVSIMDPQRFDLRGSLEAGTDVCIDINVVIEGEVKIAEGTSIGPNCIIKNSTIGRNVEILANSIIEDSVIDDACIVGPFARLRPLTHLMTGSKIGNFVETKKTTVGSGSKVNHLSYIGDTIIGEKANIGAGTITCNYDGVNKFITEIGDGAFIGSNTSLIAPVVIGANATTGAGSAIDKDIPTSNLGVARGKQRNIDTWQRPVKADK